MSNSSEISRVTETQLQSFKERGLHRHFTQILRGFEKESLRINPDGALAQSLHPAALGSALTHQWITTDYSEALLEFITPTSTDIEAPLSFLHDLHSFTYQQIEPEALWVNSMPCILGDELNIPIAEYGSSNVGRMKHAYRRGLWLRYGRKMQTIAGIHYNVSLPLAFWEDYARQQQHDGTLQDFISAEYFALIRNFLRRVGLLVYLFGASPAVCRSFLEGRPHQLPDWDESTCYLPHGTSLRMSDLGYHNDAQSGLNVSYNSLGEYVRTLQHAIRTPYPAYEALGVMRGGEYQQLNANILQIENEFYSTIRPKRVTRSGERPTCALAERGVEYIEMRCIDLDPFIPGGIDATQVRFLDLFAMHCLLQPSPPLSAQERDTNSHNLQAIVMGGRSPSLTLQRCGQPDIGFRDWAQAELEQMRPLAELFDAAHNHTRHTDALTAQVRKLDQPELTPSHQVLQRMRAQATGFHEFGMQQARSQARYFQQRSIATEQLEQFRAEQARSLAAQADMENGLQEHFDSYIERFFGQEAALCP